MYYGRKGEPLTLMEWAQKKENLEYSRIDYTELPPTSKCPASFLSTVWLGLDHGFWPGKPPVIFETMRFTIKPTESELFPGRKFHDTLEFPEPNEPYEYVEQERYYTEEQASLAHRKIVKLIQEQEMS